MVNLGPINDQLGLPFNFDINDGQNKFELKISKDLAKMSNFRPKIGQDVTLAKSLNWHITRPFFIRF